MPSVKQRVNFASRYIRTNKGFPWTTEGRDWIVDQFWKPADGYKLWPKDVAKICDDCAAKAGTIIEWDWKIVDALKRHKKCPGLRPEPILLTVLNLPRRHGKTINAAAFLLSTGCLQPKAFMTMMCGSMDQTDTIMRENYQTALDQSEELADHMRIVGNVIHFPQTGSKIECVPTALTVTGRGRRRILIDEGRDVPAKIATRLIPSVFAEYGIECPRGHLMAPASDKRTKCPTCGARLQPWFGRIIAMSSSGILKDTEDDWFAELADLLESTPDKNGHVYRLTASDNPDVHQGSKDMMERLFGAMESTKTYVDVEVHNVSRRKGEDFVSQTHIEACSMDDLPNLPGCERECFGFLDTSRVGDLTSLVIASACDDSPPEDPWHLIQVDHIKIWDPRKEPAARISPAAVQDHLDRHVPLFPKLHVLQVDTRGGMAWAADLVDECRKNRKVWGKKIHSFDYGQRAERDNAWAQLEYRLLSGTIRLPRNKTLLAELRAVRRTTRVDGTVEVRDRNRKVRHADVADALAQVCYKIYQHQIRPRKSMAEVNRRSVKDTLRAFRPHTAGIGRFDL